MLQLMTRYNSLVMIFIIIAPIHKYNMYIKLNFKSCNNICTLDVSKDTKISLNIAANLLQFDMDKENKIYNIRRLSVVLILLVFIPQR